MSLLDREALVIRNRAMAEAFHKPPAKHYIRRGLLRGIARLPIMKGQPSSKERILLIRPDHLGDTLLATPAIHALRAARPKAQIHALVGPWSAEVLSYYSEVDAVVTLPFPGFDRSGKKSRWPYQFAVSASRQLRQIGYSSAVIMRPDHWWGAMLVYLAGIPRRIGYDLPDVAPFLTETLQPAHEHAVIQNLRLIGQLTGVTSDEIHYAFEHGESDSAFVDAYLAEWSISEDRPIICIHPGSGTWVKRWNEANWADVADTLADQLDADVVFTGGGHELGLVQSINGMMQHDACLMVGDTQVGQLAALYKRARVVLGPDSGPMHLAAAVHTPTVTLFGPADPIEFAPWGSPEKHIILMSEIGCRPCRVLNWDGDKPEYHPCVKEITVGRVLEAARRAATD